jgi:signal transduction histidine kinase
MDTPEYGERLRSVSTHTALPDRPPERVLNDGHARHAAPGPRPSRPRGRFGLQNWRVRSRLVALILVPTIAAVLLAGFLIFTSVTAAADYARANRVAQLASQVSALAHELQAERDRMTWYIALGRAERALPAVREQIGKADAEAGRVRDSAALLVGELTGRTQDEVETVRARLLDLPALREQALEQNLLPDAAIDQYSLLIADLLALYDELGKGSADDVLYGQTITLEALARAKESASRQRALLTEVLVVGRFEQEQVERFLGALATEQNERKNFEAEATTDQRRFFDETVNGRAADRALFLRELVLIRTASGAPLKGLDLSKRDDAREWFDAMSVVVDRIRTVEARHVQAVATRTDELRGAEQNRAFIVAGAVVALLLAVLLITTGVARSLVRPLRRLRSEALEIAGHRLPEFVQRVRESRGEPVPAEVPPIGIFSEDEVGEVARAFEEVHREAVRLAGDEARLRSNVNSIFINLSRRSQTLVERQLTLIERLERGERDDKRLADLFKLDHLATRMRRNSENLLVLAGQEAARRWSKPVELMDVVRASLSEVEGYDRVDNRVRSEISVVGQAVTDVVHLLAELVENALSFSPRDTKVVVSSSRLNGGGAMIAVTDQGIGMTAEELAQANWRLANPPVVDVSVSRRMGLFVVGRLALRHGIRVQLRSQDVGGLTAMVLIPEALLAPIPGAAPLAPAGVQPAMQPGMHSTGAFAPPRQPPGPMPPSGPTSGGLPRRTPAPPPRGAVGQPGFGGGAPGYGGRPGYGGQPGVGGESMFGGEPVFGGEPASGRQSAFGGSPSRSGLPAAPWMEQEGPPPVDPADGGEDFLPIFSAVESDWFRKPSNARPPTSAAPPGDVDGGDTGELPDLTRLSETVGAGEVDAPGVRAPESRGDAGIRDAGGERPGGAWASPGDAGWQAARVASEPAMDGVTAAGLPKRQPKANLVPGSVAPAQPAMAAPQPPPRLSADRTRSRLSSFQQGVRKGRAEVRGESTGPAGADPTEDTGKEEDA